MKTWIKSIGSADWQMSDDWTQNKEDADNLTGIDFPYEPQSISIGDKLVLYASGHRCVFGIAEVTSGFSKTDRHERWSIRCDVRMLLAVPHLSNAPSLEELVLKNGRDLMLSVRQNPYVELEPAEYLRAVNALTSRVLAWA